MSRAVLMIALYQSLGRLPTDDEKARFLKSMADQSGGNRIYIAHRQMTDSESEAEIKRLHDDGFSIRRIAGACGCSKYRVEDVLAVRKSALLSDSKGA